MTSTTRIHAYVRNNSGAHKGSVKGSELPRKKLCVRCWYIYLQLGMGVRGQTPSPKINFVCATAWQYIKIKNYYKGCDHRSPYRHRPTSKFPVPRRVKPTPVVVVLHRRTRSSLSDEPICNNWHQETHDLQKLVCEFFQCQDSQIDLFIFFFFNTSVSAVL